MKDEIKGFCAFTVSQAGLVGLVIFFALDTGCFNPLLILALVALLSLWSLASFIVERRNWNNGISDSGAPWYYSGRTLTKRCYCTFDTIHGTQLLRLSHYDPQATCFRWFA